MPISNSLEGKMILTSQMQRMFHWDLCTGAIYTPIDHSQNIDTPVYCIPVFSCIAGNTS